MRTAMCPAHFGQPVVPAVQQHSLECCLGGCLDVQRARCTEYASVCCSAGMQPAVPGHCGPIWQSLRASGCCTDAADACAVPSWRAPLASLQQLKPDCRQTHQLANAALRLHCSRHAPCIDCISGLMAAASVAWSVLQCSLNVHVGMAHASVFSSSRSLSCISPEASTE